MKEYDRPIIMATEELAEGVYAASGSNPISVSSVELISEGNQWNKVNTYKVTIRNSGSADLADWIVSISVTSGTATNATVYNGWQASASLNGKKITITPGGGGVIEAGGAIDVEVVVTYDSDSVTVSK